MLTLQFSHPLLQHPVLFEELFVIFEWLSLHFEREFLLQSEKLQPQHQLIFLIHLQAFSLCLAEHLEELSWSGDDGIKSSGQTLFVEPVDQDVGLAGMVETDVDVMVG